MERKSTKTFKLAFCGIMTALSVVVMFAALIPSMTYVFPAVSGIILWSISEQINKKWALLSYVAASLLAFMLIPELEANLFFILFFGYYPILRSIFEKLKPKILSVFTKFGIFNIAVIIIYFIMCLVFNADKMIEGMEDFGEFALPALWLMGNVAFFCYDLCLGYLIIAYDRWLKPHFSKLFR